VSRTYSLWKKYFSANLTYSLQGEVHVQIGGGDSSEQSVEARRKFLEKWIALVSIYPSSSSCSCAFTNRLDSKMRRFRSLTYYVLVASSTRQSIRLQKSASSTFLDSKPTCAVTHTLVKHRFGVPSSRMARTTPPTSSVPSVSCPARVSETLSNTSSGLPKVLFIPTLIADCSRRVVHSEQLWEDIEESGEDDAGSGVTDFEGFSDELPDVEAAFPEADDGLGYDMEVTDFEGLSSPAPAYQGKGKGRAE
jgi:hypothetical protein